MATPFESRLSSLLQGFADRFRYRLLPIGGSAGQVPVLGADSLIQWGTLSADGNDLSNYYTKPETDAKLAELGADTEAEVSASDLIVTVNLDAPLAITALAAPLDLQILTTPPL